jgi:pyruvate dehydrogenase E1 component beta subunit
MNAPTLVEAARDALNTIMGSEPDVVVLGEDVGLGGPFGLTKNLLAKFGAERVRNTPISEGAVMGVAIGLALGGKRPFVDLMFDDFLTLASDQLFNHGAKIHYMSGGRYSVPLTIWTVGGAGTRWGAHHSQRLDGWLAQIPGLNVLAPSSPKAAANAISEGLATLDPTVILVDRTLLYRRDALPGDEDSPFHPRVVRRGNALTVVATGRLVHLALEASLNTGIDAEVIDIQLLAPLELEAGSGAMASMIASAIYDKAFWYLDAPIVRLVSPAKPVPAAPALEDHFLISLDRLCVAMQGLIEK